MLIDVYGIRIRQCVQLLVCSDFEMQKIQVVWSKLQLDCIGRRWATSVGHKVIILRSITFDKDLDGYVCVSE